MIGYDEIFFKIEDKKGKINDFLYNKVFFGWKNVGVVLFEN